MESWLNRYFKLKENSTSIRTEMVGGITTFMTMSYIIFMQPAILSAAGMARGAMMIATCEPSAVSTLLLEKNPYNTFLHFRKSIFITDVKDQHKQLLQFQ